MSCLQPLNLTIVGDRHCPTTRMYLAYMHSHGYQPRCLLLTDFLYVPQFYNRTQKILYKLHPNLYKKFFNLPQRQFSSSFIKLCELLQKPFDLQVNLTDDNFDFSQYAKQVVRLKAWDFDDKSLHHQLLKLKKTTFLYTNGGKVPANLLNAPNFKMLHIHPGIVPLVRGSDGLFWSLLTRQKIGASCFYMDPGIDSGDLIHQAEFSCHRFSGLEAHLNENLPELRAAILHAYDPHFRAKVLLNALKQANGKTENLISKKQDHSQAVAYYSMHPKLLKKVIKEFFCSP